VDPLLQQEITEDDAVTLSTEWASRARQQGVEVETVVRVETPHKLLREEAERTHAILVVVGTHGRTGARRLVLGSVAEKVVRHSDRPVLVVPSGSKPRATRQSGRGPPQ
jgi:nucleotide-binding universal stress UspA family protein